MNITHEQRILFTFWENRDIIITVLESGVDADARHWLENLLDRNQEMLEWYGAYMRGDEIPQDDLYEED